MTKAVNPASTQLVTSVAVKSICVYSITRDEGRVKRRRRTDDATASKFQPQDGTSSNKAIQGTKSTTSALTGDAPRREKKSTDDIAQRAQSQKELQSFMSMSPGADAQLADNSVPPQQDGLLQELENDFDLLDASVFDISPDLNLHAAKSFTDFLGDISGPDLDHDLDFVPKPTYPSIPISSTPPVLPAPSEQMSDGQISRNISRDDGDDVVWSPSSSLESSNTGKVMRLSSAINRHKSHSPPAKVVTCDCLIIKVSLLEELGSQKMEVSLSEGLATYKGCLEKSRSVLECRMCMSKSESVMLLVMVYERLVSSCEILTDAYLKRQSHLRSRASSPEPDRLRLKVGRYELDKGEEWDCVLGALTLFQVKTLGRQLLAMREPASIVLRGSQISKLFTCERRMRALVELFRSN
ncbi:MAG: hypothetical protein Q9202_003735 [Teloschistes flavicans]